MNKQNEQFHHLLKETIKAFGTDKVPAVKLFDEYYDFYGKPLNLQHFYTYIHEELVGMYVIEQLKDGLHYRFTDLTQIKY